MKLTIILIFLFSCLNIQSSEHPKIVDASYDSTTVYITVFYRSNKTGSKIYDTGSIILIDGKEYIIKKSDIFFTDSHTGKQNVIVEFIYDIPKELKNKNIEMAKIGYSLEKGSPKLVVKSFKKIRIKK